MATTWAAENSDRTEYPAPNAPEATLACMSNMVRDRSWSRRDRIEMQEHVRMTPLARERPVGAVLGGQTKAGLEAVPGGVRTRKSRIIANAAIVANQALRQRPKPRDFSKKWRR